eukprot:g7975.t1
MLMNLNSWMNLMHWSLMCMAEEQEAVDSGKVPSYLSTPNEPALPTASPMSTGPNQALPETQQQDQQAHDAYGLPVVPQRN